MKNLKTFESFESRLHAQNIRFLSNAQLDLPVKNSGFNKSWFWGQKQIPLTLLEVSEDINDLQKGDLVLFTDAAGMNYSHLRALANILAGTEISLWIKKGRQKILVHYEEYYTRKPDDFYEFLINKIFNKV